MTANLPDFVPESLRAQARAVSLKRKQSLFRFDDAVQSLFFVRQGEMEAVRYSPDGEAMVMMRAGGGEFFGEPALAVDRYTCAANARIDSELLALPKVAVMAAFLSDPGFASAFLLGQVRNARRQCSRYERVRLRRAEDRIFHYLVCEAGPDGSAILAGSLAEWAGELGLQPESLYRALAHLRGDGRIVVDGTRIRMAG